jgi:hypothetical protein
MELCNFLRFKQRDGLFTSWLAQNFYVGQSISYDGSIYPYVPIVVATNASSGGGDRSEAVLGAAMNALTLSIFSEAVQEDWLLEVKTVLINRSDLSLGPLLQSEYWATQQVQHDSNEPVVRLQLASPLDAVRNGGGRVLSQELVGSLPVSGTLTLQ